MTLLGQFGRKKCGDNIAELVDRILAAAESEDIRSVVLARIAGESSVVTGGGSNAGDFVCCHRAADAGTVDDDADVCTRFADCFCDGVCIVRIIDSVGRVRSKIIDLNAKASEKFFELFFKRKSAVVCTDGDGADF